MKRISKIGVLVLASSGLIFSCGNKEEQSTVDANDKPVVINTESKDGLVYEIALDAQSYSIKKYVGKSNNVVIPETFEGLPVKGIKKFAFRNSAVTKVHLPKSIESIEEYAFIGNDVLNEFEVDKENQSFVVRDSGLYRVIDKDSETYELVCAIAKLSGEFEVSEKLSVLNGAFQSTNLTILKFNAQKLSGHFHKWFGLTNDAIPSTFGEVVITGGNVNSNAFIGINNLEAVVLKEGVGTIGDRAFFNCSNLNSVLIPDSLTSIGEKAFANCANLKLIRIGNSESPSLSSIGDGAFQNDESLILEEKSGLLYFGNPNVKHLVLVKAKDKSLSYYATQSETKFILDEAFKGCSKAEEISIPSVFSIGSTAFAGCASLEDVTLPARLKTIGSKVFDGTKVITEHGINDNKGGVYLETSDGQKRLLVKLDSTSSNLIVHEDTAWIDTYALNSNTKLKTIECDSNGYRAVDDRYLVSADSTILYGTIKDAQLEGFNLLSNIREIAPYALSFASAENFVLPNKLIKIGDNAFDSFEELDGVNNPELKLPETVLSIGNSAFENLSGYDTISLNDGLLVLGEKALANNAQASLNPLFLPGSLSYVGANVFEGSKFSSIKVEADENPSNWDAKWSGSTPIESIMFGASR